MFHERELSRSFYALPPLYILTSVVVTANGFFKWFVVVGVPASGTVRRARYSFFLVRERLDLGIAVTGIFSRHVFCARVQIVVAVFVARLSVVASSCSFRFSREWPCGVLVPPKADRRRCVLRDY
jgi:hypothetical protein